MTKNATKAAIGLEDGSHLAVLASGEISAGDHVGGKLVGFGPRPDGKLTLTFDQVFDRARKAMFGMKVVVTDKDGRTHVLATVLRYAESIPY